MNFVLTRRMFVEGRAGSLLNKNINDYYDDNNNYDGQEGRIDDLIYMSELEWDSLFGTEIKEVTYNV